MDPRNGRFLGFDPLEGRKFDPTTLHRYLYVGANPLNNVDPSGQETLVNAVVTAAIVGVLAGGTLGYIRGGWEQAKHDALWGALLGPASVLGVTGIGIGLAAVTGLAVSTTVSAAAAAAGVGSVGWSTYELIHAQNDRDRLAAGVSIIFTVAGAAYGAYRFSDMPSIAPNGNNLPASKAQLGTFLSEVGALGRGGVVVAREVTIETPAGVRVRVDMIIRDIFGRLRLVDAKFGPNADFTPNQLIGYPAIGRAGGIVRGANGAAAGLPDGTVLPPTPVQVDWWQ